MRQCHVGIIVPEKSESTSDTTPPIVKKQEWHDNRTIMSDTEFDEQTAAYAKEARERWGNTDAYKQSEERVSKMTKADMQKIKDAGEALTRSIAACMEDGIASDAVQVLIAQHYNGLRTFYEPTPEMYRGLGDMYVDDQRFAAYYEKFAKGLAQFMRDAMYHYVDTVEKKK